MKNFNFLKFLLCCITLQVISLTVKAQCQVFESSGYNTDNPCRYATFRIYTQDGANILPGTEITYVSGPDNFFLPPWPGGVGTTYIIPSGYPSRDFYVTSANPYISVYMHYMMPAGNYVFHVRNNCGDIVEHTYIRSYSYLLENFDYVGTWVCNGYKVTPQGSILQISQEGEVQNSATLYHVISGPVGISGYIETGGNFILSVAGIYTIGVTWPGGLCDMTTFTVVCPPDPGLDPATLVPATPDVINGPASVCAGSGAKTYSVDVVENATHYTWTFPSGWTPSSITTTVPTVTATPPSNNITANISVTADNNCGSSSPKTLSVTVGTNIVPAMPDIITGETTVCANGSPVTYSILAINDATTGYTWTLPSGWTGSSNTNVIIATPETGAISGNISVTANNECGNSPAQNLAVTVENTIPNTPGVITGDNVVCEGGGYKVYNIDPVIGATSYTWTFPYGWTAPSFTTTLPTITVAMSAVAASGNISVTANNSCGSSAESILAITVGAATIATPYPIRGENLPCYNAPSIYSIDSVAGATNYEWSIDAMATFYGWTITPSPDGLSASVMHGTQPWFYCTITVRAKNTICNITGGNADLMIQLATAAPAQPPAAISGPTTVCTGSSATYQATIVAGINYEWTLPNGWTITSGDDTYNITAMLSNNAIDGNISVKAKNGCGSSNTAQILPVTVNDIPATPDNITGSTTISAGGAAETYTITAVTNATTYTWTVPAEWNIVDGQGTTEITVTPPTSGASNGVITVTADNLCGSSTPQTLSVTVTINNNPFGTVFPFVYIGDAGFDSRFVTTAKLYAMPPATVVDKLGYIRKQTPLQTVQVEYYNCTPTTLIAGIPEQPGTMGFFNNAGMPIQWHLLGYSGTPNNATGRCPDTPIGIYTFKNVDTGNYILEISRQGFLSCYGVIEVTGSTYLGHRELIGGDVNGDLVIDGKDISATTLKNYSFGHPSYEWKYDLTGNKEVGDDDINIIRINMNAGHTIYLETKIWVNP